MLPRPVNRRARRRRNAFLFAAALASVAATIPAHSADPDATADQLPTATPIKHVIVVIGENRSFDHIYGTYVPKSGEFDPEFAVGEYRRCRRLARAEFRRSEAVHDIGPDELFHRRRH